METIDHTTQNPVLNVLSGFYKNASVGAHSISRLLPEVEDMKLRRELFRQRDYYEAQKKQLRSQMADIFLEPLESGKAAQYWTDLVIQAKARCGMMTTAAAAKLMVEGTNMGMVQIHQVLNHNPNIPDDLKEQGDRILAHEKQYLDCITPYL